MPITPTYPGVYIEEIPSGVHTITGVATSIAAFLGRTAKGPLNKAVRCFNYSDFTRAFAGAHPKSDLANSVRLFFTNGGTECCVIRLAKGAEKASVTLKSLGGDEVLVATAKTMGEWGNTVRLEVDYNTDNPDETFNLRVIQEEDGRVAASESFTNLSMYPESPRFAPDFVTQSSDLIDLALAVDPGDYNSLSNSFPGFSQSRRRLQEEPMFLKNLIYPPPDSEPPNTKFEISVNGSPFKTVDLRPWTALESASDASELPSSTDVESHFNDRISDALGSSAHAVVCSVRPEAPADKNYIALVAASGDYRKLTVRRASSNDIAAALMLGVDQGGIEVARWSNFRPAPTAALMALGMITSTSDGLPASNIDDDALPNNFSFIDEITNLVNPIANLAQNAFNSIAIDSDTVDLNDEFSIVTTGAGEQWFKSEALGTVHGDNDGVREKLKIIANAINNAQIGKRPDEITWHAEVWGYHLAVMAKNGTINTKPSIDTASDVFDNGFFDTSGGGSYDYTNVRQYKLGTGGTGTYSIDGTEGDDGTAPELAEFLGNEEEQTGFHALDPVDLFNLMIIPGDEDVNDPEMIRTIWGAASGYCEKHRALLLIDPPADWVKDGRPCVVQDTSLVGYLRAAVTNTNSAVFYPPLKYQSNGLKKLIGPSGAIAGLMARTDAARGVWKAPAGTEADIRGILGLQVKLTDMENGVLNKLAVNCLREFPGNYVCWGSRTMAGYDNSSQEDWKYIPVRRLALFLEESLFRGSKWVVFEPNDEPLWAKIRLNVGAFMMRLFRQGAFQGSTPDKAFYVKCDSETTTQADINLGIVNIEVGFAPLKPAEFVIIKIQQIAGEL